MMLCNVWWHSKLAQDPLRRYWPLDKITVYLLSKSYLIFSFIYNLDRKQAERVLDAHDHWMKAEILLFLGKTQYEWVMTVRNCWFPSCKGWDRRNKLVIRQQRRLRPHSILKTHPVNFSIAPPQKRERLNDTLHKIREWSNIVVFVF